VAARPVRESESDEGGFAMSLVPVPQEEPDVAVPASGAGEAAEILALLAALLAAEPEAGMAACRLLEARGADPLPALDWLAEGAGRLAGVLDGALSYEGIACDRVLDRYRRQP
jgi:hypothetical protein